MALRSNPGLSLLRVEFRDSCSQTAFEPLNLDATLPTLTLPYSSGVSFLPHFFPLPERDVRNRALNLTFKLHLDANPAHPGKCSPALGFPVGSPVGSPRAWDRAVAPSLTIPDCGALAIMLFNPGPRKAPCTLCSALLWLFWCFQREHTTTI